MSCAPSKRQLTSDDFCLIYEPSKLPMLKQAMMDSGISPFIRQALIHAQKSDRPSS